MHVEKYHGTQVPQLLTHYNRNMGKDREYSNTDIDKARTALNYNLAPARDVTDYGYMKERLSQVKIAHEREDTVKMCDWVVTLPKDYTGDSREFFTAAYDALSERYGGEQNVISAYVHMDETTPHMHFAFMPIYTDYSKDVEGQERLCAKKVVCRTDLTHIHRDIEREMSRDLGIDVHLINGATKEQGNKDVRELKAETARQLDVAIAEKTGELSELSEQTENERAAYDCVHADRMKELKDLERLTRTPVDVPKGDKGMFGKVTYSQAEFEAYRERIEARCHKAERERDEFKDKWTGANLRANTAEKNEQDEHDRYRELERQLSNREFLKERLQELERMPERERMRTQDRDFDR